MKIVMVIGTVSVIAGVPLGVASGLMGRSGLSGWSRGDSPPEVGVTVAVFVGVGVGVSSSAMPGVGVSSMLRAARSSGCTSSN